MLVSDSYPNLINGVSQQAEALRLSSQVEALENANCSVVDGLHKRQPTQHIAQLSTANTYTGSYCYLINRDSSERYIVLIKSGTLKVFNLAGVEQTVSFPDGTSYLTATGNAQEAFRAATVADTTFIVNRQKTAAMAVTQSASRAPACLIWVRQGLVGHTYIVEALGIPQAIFCDSVSSIVRTMDVAFDLCRQLRSYTAFKDGGAAWVSEELVNATILVSGVNLVSTKIAGGAAVTKFAIDPVDVTTVGGHTVLVADNSIRVRAPLTDLFFNAVSDNVIFLQRINSADFTIKVYDSFGDQALQVIKDKVQLFSDLPTKAYPDMKVEVAGAEGTADDYWVKFVPDSTATFGRGSWSETVGPLVHTTIDAATMPFVLVRTGVGTFDFKKAPWLTRTVGDETSAPNPSFIGSTINDVFVYRGRLGLLSGEHVILTQAGEFFNFWPTTVTTLLDDARIDYRVGGTAVASLYQAVPYQDQLLLFSDQSQLTLTHGETLTQKSVAATVTTFFDSNVHVKPVSSGSSVLFAFTRGAFSGLREYFTNFNGTSNDAADVSAHIPKFISGDATGLSVSTAMSAAVLRSTAGSNAAYIYQWLWSGQTKVQSAWNKWTFDGDPLGCLFVGEVLYMVMQRSSGVWLEKMELAKKVDSGLDYMVCLDRKATATFSSYSATLNRSTFTTPYYSANLQLIKDGVTLQNVSITDNGTTGTVVVKGNYSTGVVAGVPYTFLVTLSRPFVKVDAKAGGFVAINEGRLQVSNFILRYADSGYFKVTVSPDRYNNWDMIFTGRIIGSSNNVIGSVALESGVFNFPVRARNEELEVTIRNDNFMPCFLLSAEWQGIFNPITRRV